MRPGAIIPDAGTLPRTRLRQLLPEPKLVEISFAGSRGIECSVAGRHWSRSPGDRILLIREGDPCRIENAEGKSPAHLFRPFALPEGITFLRGEVVAIRDCAT